MKYNVMNSDSYCLLWHPAGCVITSGPNAALCRGLSAWGAGGAQGVTHVIIDEIHERDRFADFLLVQLRELLPRNPQLRVILMSATLHEALFSDYFGGCPIVRVPGERPLTCFLCGIRSPRRLAWGRRSPMCCMWWRPFS